jgi:hypothetical protein
MSSLLAQHMLNPDGEGALSLVKPLLEDLKPSEVQLDTLMHIWIEGGTTDAHLAPNPRGVEISAWEKWTAAMERMYNRSSTDASFTCVDYGKLMVSYQNTSNRHLNMVHSRKSILSDPSLKPLLNLKLTLHS